MHAIAEIATFEPMVPAPHLEEGSLESIIDDALGEGRAADDGTAVEARVRALSENAQRLLASLGRFQMEFAAAALASRRMAPTSELAWILKRIFLACRTIAERLIAALQAIDGMRTEAMEPFNSIGREMNASLRALRNDVRTVRARGLSLLAATLRLPETRDLLPPLPRPPIRASCRILWLEAESMREGGRMGEALRLLEEALDVALDEDDLAVAAEGALLLTVQHLREGRVVEALLPLERAIDLAIASTHTLVEAVGRSLRMSLDLAAHRWDAVETDAQAQRQCAARRNNLPAMVDASLNLCAVHLARERPTEAVSGLIEAGQHVLISGDARLLVPLKARMAEIREDLGREAFEDLIRRVKSLHEG
jgi:tetratricopeptide (TPR) repeat protein